MRQPQPVFRIVSGVAIATMLLMAVSHAQAESHIVLDGVGRAEIVVAPERPRMATIAALELQHYLEKMTGARLPIVTAPGDGALKVYVGRSDHTDALGVKADDLKYGAYRMVSGSDWLALVGYDFDFVPLEPWPKRRNDIERATAEWDKVVGDRTDSAWGFPFSRGFKAWWGGRDDQRSAVRERYGEDNEKLWPGGSYNTPISTRDEGGTLNAVCGFLRSLGCRWYLPGDIGEVLPARESVRLPQVDRVDRPDHPLRYWFGAHQAYTLDDLLWERRIGMNSGDEALGLFSVHGLSRFSGRREMKEKHPEYYALIAGKRDTEHRGAGTLCYSSPGMTQEVVKYVRFLFGTYDLPHVSIWPVDGFKLCGCELCEGKQAPELVWGFVDRVAREVYTTHPDKIVSCGAYAQYQYPPKNVEKFTPNVAVFIANQGRPLFDNPERWQVYTDRIETWRKKLAPNRIVRNENNRWNLRGPFPVIHTLMYAKDLRYMRHASLGEWNEMARSNRGEPGRTYMACPGLDHLNLYVNARLLWDMDQDLQKMVHEYCELFYGPASEEMKAAVEFAEENYDRSGVGRRGKGNPAEVALSLQIRVTQMLLAAREKAGDTVYGKRVQAWLDEVPSLETLKQQQAKVAENPNPRADAPVVAAPDASSERAPEAHHLRDLVTGKPVDVETEFTVAWDKGALVFDIRCQEPDMANLYLTRQVYNGDSVAILIETPAHAYYQIEINPDGVVFDADRRGGVKTRWESMADVKSEKGKDYWRVVARFPVANLEEGTMDPFHYIVGPKPTAKDPWFFNVGRVRIRDGKKSVHMFSPVGKMTYHDTTKFAKLIVE